MACATLTATMPTILAAQSSFPQSVMVSVGLPQHMSSAAKVPGVIIISVYQTIL